MRRAARWLLLAAAAYAVYLAALRAAPAVEAEMTKAKVIIEQALVKVRKSIIL